MPRRCCCELSSVNRRGFSTMGVICVLWFRCQRKFLCSIRPLDRSPLGVKRSSCVPSALSIVVTGVPAMPPTPRMTPDEKRTALDMHARGSIPSLTAGHLGRDPIVSSVAKTVAVSLHSCRCDRPHSTARALAFAPSCSTFLLCCES